jgi:hypothetical protein
MLTITQLLVNSTLYLSDIKYEGSSFLNLNADPPCDKPVWISESLAHFHGTRIELLEVV